MCTISSSHKFPQRLAQEDQVAIGWLHFTITVQIYSSKLQFTIADDKLSTKLNTTQLCKEFSILLVSDTTPPHHPSHGKFQSTLRQPRRLKFSVDSYSNSLRVLAFGLQFDVTDTAFQMQSISLLMCVCHTVPNLSHLKLMFAF